MSSAPAATTARSRGRVRHRAREAASVMAFSAACSIALTGCLVLLTRVGG